PSRNANCCTPWPVARHSRRCSRLTATEPEKRNWYERQSLPRGRGTGRSRFTHSKSRASVADCRRGAVRRPGIGGRVESRRSCGSPEKRWKTLRHKSHPAGRNQLPHDQLRVTGTTRSPPEKRRPACVRARWRGDYCTQKSECGLRSCARRDLRPGSSRKRTNSTYRPPCRISSCICDRTSRRREQDELESLGQYRGDGSCVHARA